LKGNIPESVQAYTKALSIDPKDLEVRVARATVYLEAEQFEDAFKDLDVASSLDVRCVNSVMIVLILNTAK
jgi:Flp pilus assembly protein TadD